MALGKLRLGDNGCGCLLHMMEQAIEDFNCRLVGNVEREGPVWKGCHDSQADSGGIKEPQCLGQPSAEDRGVKELPLRVILGAVANFQP